MSKDLVLWGYHPKYVGPDGSVKPIKIHGGTSAQVNAAASERRKQGGWTLGIYANGDAPEGLRAQCANDHSLK